MIGCILTLGNSGGAQLKEVGILDLTPVERHVMTKR